MAFPFPGLAFVIGNLHRETVASALSVVAEEDPMSLAQAYDFRTRARIGQLTVRHRTPSFATVARFALMKSLGRRAVVAHEREERILAAHDAGLNVSRGNQRRASVPGFSPIIRNG